MAACPWVMLPRLGENLTAATLLRADVEQQEGNHTASCLEDRVLDRCYQKKANMYGE